MRKRALAVLSGAFVLSACGATGPREPNLSGIWSADLYAFTGAGAATFYLDLHQNRDSITGAWSDGVVGTLQGWVDGRIVGDSVNMVFAVTSSFAGRLNASGDTLRGTFINGATPQGLVFVRQR